MTTDTKDRIVESIHGPIISSSDLSAHLAFFGAFGLREIGRCDRSAEETQAIWRIEGQASREILMETPGSQFGVRLVQFTPGSTIQIRDPSRGSDSEALKVIDFYSPDMDAAWKEIEAAGYQFKPEVADYETPRGRFQEAHLWGPDGVVCALVSGDPSLFVDRATVRDRLVSEPMSISGPVQDAAATLTFFDEVFGLGVTHRYGVEDPSFDALVGTSAQMSLRAWNVGVTPKEPYFGIIDYGLPKGSQTSVLATARPPARGMLGATIKVRDVAAVAAKAGVAVVATAIPGFGAVQMATMQAPNGGWYQAVQLEN